MSQVIPLDATTIVVKCDNEKEIEEIMDIISRKDRGAHVHSFLEFASENRILGKDYKFNREECYDR